jgi:hypothetical protein
VALVLIYIPDDLLKDLDYTVARPIRGSGLTARRKTQRIPVSVDMHVEQAGALEEVVQSGHFDPVIE